MRCVLLLVSTALCACQYGMPVVNSLDDVYPGEIILVGKVILDPPLEEGEQEVSGSLGSQENLINLFTSTEQVMIDPNNLKLRDYSTVIKAQLGEVFYSIAPYDKANITGAALFLDMSEKIYFPGGLRYAAGEQDKALYIGTIRYRRNDFYEVTGMDVIDEYQQANVEFKKKFGSSIKLKKALLEKVK